MNTKNPELALALPLYNEAAVVDKVAGDLVAAFRNEKIPLSLILVDNGSRDGTGDKVAALAARYPEVTAVTVPENRGYGHGILAGLAAAESPVRAYMVGDGQVAPADVVAVYHRLAQGDVDVVKVRRVKRGDGAARNFMSRVYNTLYWAVFGYYNSDINGTPKMCRAEVLQRLGLGSEDWFIDAEYYLKARYLGLRITEVPIAFLEREGGDSKVNLLAPLEFIVNMVTYRLGAFRAWKRNIRKEQRA